MQEAEKSSERKAVREAGVQLVNLFLFVGLFSRIYAAKELDIVLLRIDSNGGYLAAGMLPEAIGGGDFNPQAYLAKYDADGNLLCEEVLEDVSDLRGILPLQDGRLILQRSVEGHGFILERNGLPAGAYFFQAGTKEKVFTGKILVTD